MTARISAGALNIAAFTSARTEPLAHTVLGTDGNGFISLDEALASPEVSTLFVVLDSDQHGGISPQELARFETASENRAASTRQ